MHLILLFITNVLFSSNNIENSSSKDIWLQDDVKQMPYFKNMLADLQEEAMVHNQQISLMVLLSRNTLFDWQYRRKCLLDSQFNGQNSSDAELIGVWTDRFNLGYGYCQHNQKLMEVCLNRQLFKLSLVAKAFDLQYDKKTKKIFYDQSNSNEHKKFLLADSFYISFVSTVKQLPFEDIITWSNAETLRQSAYLLSDNRDERNWILDLSLCEEYFDSKRTENFDENFKTFFSRALRYVQHENQWRRNWQRKIKINNWKEENVLTLCYILSSHMQDKEQVKSFRQEIIASNIYISNVQCMCPGANIRLIFKNSTINFRSDVKTVVWNLDYYLNQKVTKNLATNCKPMYKPVSFKNCTFDADFQRKYIEYINSFQYRYALFREKQKYLEQHKNIYIKSACVLYTVFGHLAPVFPMTLILDTFSPIGFMSSLFVGALSNILFSLYTKKPLISLLKDSCFNCGGLLLLRSLLPFIQTYERRSDGHQGYKALNNWYQLSVGMFYYGMFVPCMILNFVVAKGVHVILERNFMKDVFARSCPLLNTFIKKYYFPLFGLYQVYWLFHYCYKKERKKYPLFED